MLECSLLRARAPERKVIVPVSDHWIHRVEVGLCVAALLAAIAAATHTRGVLSRGNTMNDRDEAAIVAAIDNGHPHHDKQTHD
jgi:hypothetical protein